MNGTLEVNFEQIKKVKTSLRLLMFLRFLKKDKNRDVGLAQFYSSIFLRACIIYYKYYNT